MQLQASLAPFQEPIPPNGNQLSLGDIFCLIAPALIFWEVVIIGRVFLAELAFAFVLPVLLLKRVHVLRHGSVRIFSVLCAFWLASQVVTDIVMNTAFEDWTRGWAKIIVFYANFLVIYLLVWEKRYRIIYIFAGTALGYALRYFINPTEFGIEYPWKFGFGPTVTAVLVLIASWRPLGEFKRIRMLAILAAAALNFYFEFRSLGAICLFTGLFFYISEHMKENALKGSRIRSGTIALTLVAIVLAAVSVYGTYTYALEHGWFSEENELKFSRQAEGEYGTILGGRSEILISAQAIAASPIIGYGSWAKSPELAELYLVTLMSKGYKVSAGEIDTDLIQAHSHLFGAWVEAGLLGGIIWIWVLWITSKAFMHTIFRSEPIQPVFLYILLTHLWTVIFSPLNGEVRISTALSMAVVLCLADFYFPRKRNSVQPPTTHAFAR